MMSVLNKINSTLRSNRLRLAAILSCVLVNCQAVDAQRGFVDFEKIVLDAEFTGGYGVELADIDGDSLLDVVALASNPAALVWFKNPRWERYSITTATASNIDTAANDIDGDGDLDLALASDFSLSESTEGGSVHWLENPGDPIANQEWEMHFIGRVPATHRIEWADLNNDGSQVLLSLPIVGVGASAPDYSVNLSLRAYQKPSNLNISRWASVVIDDSLQLLHGIRIVDWDLDGRDDILTASAYGVHLIQFARRGQTIAKQYLAMGDQSRERPAVGASEIDTGSLGNFPGAEKFLATIEPWHGDQVVVYTQGSNRNALWDRETIADDYANGHALLVVDLDNDGFDEIVAGGRGEPYQLSIHRYDVESQSWATIELDAGGIAVSGLAAADLDSDGYQDIVAIGANTQNVVYYRNGGSD